MNHRERSVPLGLRTLLACILCLLACALLCSCGGSAGFQHKDPRPEIELDDYRKDAMQTCTTLRAADKTAKRTSSAADFAQGNESYKAGDYAAAVKSYRKAIENEPLHYGANVNLALALLQDGKEDDALTQALVAVELFEADAGCLLNFQVCAAACGFSTRFVDSRLHSWYPKYTTVTNPNASYEYNDLWGKIEAELDKVDSQDSQKRQRMLDDYDTLIDQLIANDDGQIDFDALYEYINAAGRDLGLVTQSEVSSIGTDASSGASPGTASGSSTGSSSGATSNSGSSAGTNAGSGASSSSGSGSTR